MEPDVELTCCVCQTPFLRRAKEARRNAKRSRKIYCGNACSAKDKPEIRKNWNNPVLIEHHLKPNWGVGKRCTELSPFKHVLAKTKLFRSRGRKHDNEMTLEYLKEIWDSQGGICPYTGQKMTLHNSYIARNKGGKNPFNASLDRIDSSKGYVKGNVEFVCMAVNLAKNSMSKQIMLDFFSQVRDTKPVLLQLPEVTTNLNEV